MFSTSGLWGCVLDGRVSVVVEDGSAAFGGVLVEEPGPVLGYLGLVVACFISADVEVHTWWGCTFGSVLLESSGR